MSRQDSDRILITGSTGQIGSELLVELSKAHGRDKIVASDVRAPKNGQKEYSSFQYLDVTDKASLERVVKDQDIGTIFHLAGILSVTGEMNPRRTWNVNTGGLCNVLQVTKEKRGARVFWPSSIAVFGPNVPRKNTPQDSPLVPSTIYGVTKVSGELLCNYYFNRFGLDVRSIRFPGIISYETLPGGGTTDYAVELFYEAIKRKQYTSFVKEDTVLPMLYMADCIQAVLDLMKVDRSRIQIHSSYNLSGLSFPLKDLVAEIRRYIPELTVEYKPDFRQQIADSWPMSIDDTPARRDWGWEPAYTLASMTKDMIEKLSKRI